MKAGWGAKAGIGDDNLHDSEEQIVHSPPVLAREGDGTRQIQPEIL